jgi:hypothetical protein
MTIILMLSMFAIFLTIDYFMKKNKVAVPEAETAALPAAAPSLPTYVAGFDLPNNRNYHQGHTWALQEAPPSTVEQQSVVYIGHFTLRLGKPNPLSVRREGASRISALGEATGRASVERFRQSCRRGGCQNHRGQRERLDRYQWPGNIRELENAVERSMVVAQEPELRESDFALRLPLAGNASRTLEDMEKIHILTVLDECKGNQTLAAELLDIDHVTLHNKLKKYGWKRVTADAL